MSSPHLDNLLTERARTGRLRDEIVFMRGDGTRFAGEVRSEKFVDEQGRDRTILIVRDLTEQKQAIEAMNESKVLLYTVVNSTQDLIWSVDSESFGLLWFNHALSDYLFRTRGLHISNGMRPEELFNDDAHIHLWHDFYQTALQEGSFTAEYEVPARTNVLQLNLNVMRRGGAIFGISVFGRDITAHKEAERLLVESEEQYRLLIAAMEEGVTLQDENSAILAFNKSTERILGLSTDQLEGKTSFDPDWHSIHEDGSPFPGEMHPVVATLRTGLPQSNVIMGIHKPDGSLTWISINVQPIFKDGMKTPFRVVATMHDITERKSAEAHIEFLAYHDVLTKLPNRQLAKDHFVMAGSFADRANSKLAVIFIDLDNFKTINDTLGHPIGDALLKAVAARLCKCLRDTDTLSRQGGDEFLILLTGVHDPESITVAVEKLLKGLTAPFEIENHQLSTSISIGIAVYPDDCKDFDTLLKKADTAMYQAKGAGRNTYRFYTEQMNIDAIESLRMRNSLRQALDSTEFILHYQPQIDLTSGAVIGAEALIRWNHPELGLVPPARFIPVAEESGLIVQIGDWVLLEACRQAVAWRNAGLPEMVIAVNISAVQFRHHNLENSVIQALADSGLNPACLELELTESILIHDIEMVLASVQRLKALGVKLSIDDFGTGYSSLSYLKRFNVDKLKIDQSFVRDMATDPNDAAIVRAIIRMAHSLNLKTIAEGVENERALSILQLQNCDEAQGYHFARPVPPNEFVQFVMSRIG